MRHVGLRLAALGFACSMSSIASAAALYSENFDTDHTANWSYNSSISPDGPANNSNNEANFFFDYGVAGIPSAPHSTGGTTRGLKMEANVFGTAVATFSGMSASPIGFGVSGDCKLAFDAWGNYTGPLPGGGSGTTQCLGGGLNTATSTAQFPGGTINGTAFAATLDGGSGVDYRAYNSGAISADTSGAYAAGNLAGSTNNSNAYYGPIFPSVSVPAAQTTYASTTLGFANQTGSTAAGTMGMAWHYWEIARVGAIVTWTIDGSLIATLDTTGKTLGGNNIFVNYFDTNTGASTDAVSRQLLFGLVDNVSVTPEPTTLAALAVCSLLGLRRRSR